LDEGRGAEIFGATLASEVTRVHKQEFASPWCHACARIVWKGILLVSPYDFRAAVELDGTRVRISASISLYFGSTSGRCEISSSIASLLWTFKIQKLPLSMLAGESSVPVAFTPSPGQLAKLFVILWARECVPVGTITAKDVLSYAASLWYVMTNH
jgi:hypothetical protein